MRRDQAGRVAGLGVLAAALSVGTAWGQAATTLVMPQGPLLPVQFGGWTRVGTAAMENGGSPMVEGQRAEVLREDGLMRSSEESYGQAGRGGTMKIDAFQFGDATGAVSAYTFLRLPEMKVVAQGAAHVGREEAAAGGRYLFREGSSVVLAEVSSPGGSPAGDLRTLAGMLPKIGGPKGAPPLLPTLLPGEGLVPESVRYAVGPTGYAAMGGGLPAGILGFDKSGEAATAEYAVHGSRGVLTLLLLPTPEIAGDRGRAVATALTAAGARAGTTKLRREGPLLVLATGGFTAAEAAALVDGIHLRSEVTWNKPVPPEFHVEVRKTASLLVSIAVLSGVLGLAAVLLGLFLGFGRAGIRVLMGKPAAMEPEFLRLDLGGARGDGGGGQKTAGT